MISQNLNVNLRWKENLENSSLIATDNISLTQEVPDTIKKYNTIPATNLSTSGATYQSSGLARYIQFDNLYVETTMLITVATKTFEPYHSASEGASVGSPPYVFWPGINCSVDAMALNKSMNNINWQLGSNSWTEPRIDREFQDFVVAQLDQKLLNAYGIYPFEDEGIVQKRYLMGNGQNTRAAIDNAGPSVVGGVPAYANVAVNGFSSSIPIEEQDTPNLKTGDKQVRNGYVTVGYTSQAGTTGGVSYFYNSTPSLQGATPLQAIPGPQYGPGVMVPSADGATVYYSVQWDGTTLASNQWLIQTMPITIHEYLVSPFCACSRYSKNPYSKTIPGLASLFTLTTYFDTNYLTNMMIKLCPPMLNNTFSAASTPAATPGVNSVILSSNIAASQLSFYTYDTKKELKSDNTRLLYYSNLKQTSVNPPVVSGANYKTPASITLVSSQLTSLNNYMILALSSKMEKQLTGLLPYITAGSIANPPLSSLSSNIYHDITSINLMYGTDSNIFFGSNVSILEAQEMTMKIMGNPELRKYILGNNYLRVTSSLYDGTDSNGLWAENAYFPDLFHWNSSPYQTGCPFLILDMSALNFQPIVSNGDPVIPNMNYGSSNAKTWQVTLGYTVNPMLTYSITAGQINSSSITIEALFYLCTKWIKTISVSGDKPMTDVRVEFDYLTSGVAQSLRDFYHEGAISGSICDEELMLVGGSFFSSLWSSIKKALPFISKAVRGVANVSGLASHLIPELAPVAAVSRAAEKGLAHFGYGRKVGRPRSKY